MWARMRTMSPATETVRSWSPGNGPMSLRASRGCCRPLSSSVWNGTWRLRSTTPLLSHNPAFRPTRRNSCFTFTPDEPAVTDREISYVEALNEAVAQEMERDPSVFVFGLDVDDHKGIQGSTKGLLERFGKDRIFTTPLSEDAMTGVAIGAAMAG